MMFGFKEVFLKWRPVIFSDACKVGFFSFLSNNSGCVTFSFSHLHIFTANIPEFNSIISSSFSGVKKKE